MPLIDKFAILSANIYRSPSIMKKAKSELLRKIHGAQVCQLVATCAKLKLADLIAEGKTRCSELSQTLKIEADLLDRFLCALVHLNLLTQTESGEYGLSEEGTLLISTEEGSLQPIAAYKGSTMIFKALSYLHKGLLTGNSPFELAFGKDVFQYMEEDPDEFNTFHDAMHFYEKSSSRKLLDCYDFSPFSTLIDVGGGMGSFLSSIVERYPTIQGTNFDLPSVIRRAKEDNPNRLHYIEGSFFDPLPGSYDGYLMRNILHDWCDEKCLLILNNLRSSMPQNSKLLIFETVLRKDTGHRMGRFSDISMFIMTPNGRERTLAEFEHLLTRSGFEMINTIHTKGSSKTIIEARPIPRDH